MSGLPGTPELKSEQLAQDSPAGGTDVLGPADHKAPPEIPPETAPFQDASETQLRDDLAEFADEAETKHVWFRRSDQLFLGVLVAAALLLMVCHWVRLSGWGLKPVEIERFASQPYEYRIDVNTANWIEWALLEGIGETLAHRIVADREQKGPFQSIDDIERVKGIGPKTLEKIRASLTISFPDGEPVMAN